MSEDIKTETYHYNSLVTASTMIGVDTTMATVAKVSLGCAPHHFTALCSFSISRRGRASNRTCSNCSEWPAYNVMQ